MAHRLVPFLLSSLVGLVLLGACNGQGEGDICDMRNGNNDCQNGYVCRQPAAPFMGSRCCPGEAPATVPACGSGNVGLGDAGTAAPDAAIDASSASDATAATTSDAAGSAPADASTDGPTE
jgi:hypothetical protein